MVVSDEATVPVVGTVQRLGLVALSDEVGTRHSGSEAIVALPSQSRGSDAAPRYRISATVLGAVDVLGQSHVVNEVCELHASVMGQRMLIRLRGRAESWAAGDRVVVEGDLSVVAAYEYESFDLPDVRGDWRVLSVEIRGHDAYDVDLESAQTGTEK